MTIYVLIREDQNEHGYIDTSITGIYREVVEARWHARIERARAREEGLRLEVDDANDAEWQVSWKIQERDVR